MFWKICRKFTVEHPCWNAISIKLHPTLLRSHFCMSVLLCICCIFLEHFFRRTPEGPASVNWDINFEKWEKIGSDHDENITITYFFAVEQVIIIKVNKSVYIASRTYKFCWH